MSISCDCSCGCEDYDSPEFYREDNPVARKTYKCCECGGDIKPGQRYNKAVGKWDGRLDIYRTCEPCNRIREHYCPGGFIFGELTDTIGNCLGFDYRDPEDEFYSDEDEEEG